MFSCDRFGSEGTSADDALRASGTSVRVARRYGGERLGTPPALQGLPPVLLNTLFTLFTSHYLSELARVEPEELERDGGAAKAFATFLVELAAAAPAALLPHVHQLDKFLDSDV